MALDFGRQSEEAKTDLPFLGPTTQGYLTWLSLSPATPRITQLDCVPHTQIWSTKAIVAIANKLSRMVLCDRVLSVMSVTVLCVCVGNPANEAGNFGRYAQQVRS